MAIKIPEGKRKKELFTMKVQIGGEWSTHSASSPERLARIWDKLRDARCEEGINDIYGGNIRNGKGKITHHVSYNGRLWEGSEAAQRERYRVC